VADKRVLNAIVHSADKTQSRPNIYKDSALRHDNRVERILNGLEDEYKNAVGDHTAPAATKPDVTIAVTKPAATIATTRRRWSDMVKSKVRSSEKKSRGSRGSKGSKGSK
jgi:hypothetical protein